MNSFGALVEHKAHRAPSPRPDNMGANIGRSKAYAARAKERGRKDGGLQAKAVEKQVKELHARGKDDITIAIRLQIPQSTVKHYLNKL